MDEKDVDRCGSLSVVAAVAIAVPAVRGLAIESPAQQKSKACGALAGDLTDSATGLQGGLAAVPPKLDGASELLNGLLKQATSLIELGCLPAPELPAAAPVKHREQLPLPPLPTLVPLPSAPALPLPSVSALPPIGGALPTVAECTDLSADLLDAVTGVLAALLSTGLPDLTGALSGLTDLLDTLTKLSDPANNCLPVPPSVTDR